MTSPADNAGPAGDAAPNDGDVKMWDVDILDAEGWNRMVKIFRAILDNTINTDSARERAVFIYSVIKQSEIFGEGDVFTTDMLKILKPEGIEIAFKNSKDKYSYKNVSFGKQCGGLSEEVFDCKFPHVQVKSSADDMLQYLSTYKPGKLFRSSEPLMQIMMMVVSILWPMPWSLKTARTKTTIRR